MAFKQFAWVPNGTYDYSEYLVRYVIVEGNPKTVISKEWVDKGSHGTMARDLWQPWGTFPDFPPKPPKKNAA